MFILPQDAEIQTALPGWTVLDKLGKGTFKVVYKAEMAGTVEALKLFHVPPFDESVEEDRVQKAKFIARLTREIRLLKACQSQHLVKLASLEPTSVVIGRQNFVAYSEEYLDGDCLAGLIKVGHLPSPSDVAGLLRCLALAVQELWNTHHCVHRDIKPDNIQKVTSSGRGFVLLDLGIIFDIDGTKLTESLISPGTPVYRAPEMLQSEYASNLNQRTDLYCIGVTAFEFATGKHPLDNGSRSSLTARILNEPPLKMLEVRPDFHPRLAKIIDRLNRKQPPLRGTVEMLLKELEQPL